MIKTIFTIFFLIFSLFSCKTDKPTTQEINKKENNTKKTAETEITTISTVSADKKLFSYQIRANGKTEAQNQKNINYEEYIKEVTDYGGNPTLPNGGINPLLHERIRTRKEMTTADLQIEEAKNNLILRSCVVHLQVL